MNDKRVFIPIVLGTSRRESASEKVANFLFEEARKFNLFNTELVRTEDLVDSPKTADMNKDNSEKWSSIMERANGLIIVLPEYNTSYPGELKLMLDEIYKEYEGKPVGLCGVSSGNFGGSRAVEALKTVLIKLKMLPIMESVYFPNVGEIFDEKGNIKDNSYSKRVSRFFNEILKYAEKLK